MIFLHLKLQRFRPKQDPNKTEFLVLECPLLRKVSL